MIFLKEPFILEKKKNILTVTVTTIVLLSNFSNAAFQARVKYSRNYQVKSEADDLLFPPDGSDDHEVEEDAHHGEAHIGNHHHCSCHWSWWNNHLFHFISNNSIITFSIN